MKPYYQEENITIYNGDCLEVMGTLQDNSIDCIITDPPYNIGKDFQNDNLNIDVYLSLVDKVLINCDRLLKWGGAFYIFCGFQTVSEVKTIINNTKSLRLKNWIIWYRQDGWKGDNGFNHSHEHILYFIKDNIGDKLHKKFIEYLNVGRLKKGLKLSDINKYYGWATTGGGCASSYMGNKKDNFLPTLKHYKLLKKLLDLDDRFDYFPFSVKFNKTDVSDDVWLKPKSEKNRWGHPTQKPTSLIRRIIIASSDKTDTILDPFLGSGTTARACKDLGRKCIGIEISKEYCDIAVKRLGQEVLF